MNNPSFDRAVSLLADSPEPTLPSHYQLVADLFGKSVDEVVSAVEHAIAENQRFMILDGTVKIMTLLDPRRFFVAFGTVDEAKKTAVVGDSRPLFQRHAPVLATELSDCRAWLESKGYTVTEKS